jgi:uncharacterized protein YukE
VSERLGRLESKVDDGFSAFDKRFEQVDKRFEQVDQRLEDINKNLADQRSQFQAMHEEHMATFRSLYDLMKMQGERMDRGFARLESKFDVRPTDHDAVLRDHARRLLILEGRARKA